MKITKFVIMILLVVAKNTYAATPAIPAEYQQPTSPELVERARKDFNAWLATFGAQVDIVALGENSDLFVKTEATFKRREELPKVRDWVIKYITEGRMPEYLDRRPDFLTSEQRKKVVALFHMFLKHPLFLKDLKEKLADRVFNFEASTLPLIIPNLFHSSDLKRTFFTHLYKKNLLTTAVQEGNLSFVKTLLSLGTPVWSDLIQEARRLSLIDRYQRTIQLLK
jgi:hypothetical protein